MDSNIIAIDGPAGSGKSTVSRLLAKQLGYLYIDTGAMYRALTLKALRKKIDLNDEQGLTGLAKETSLNLVNDTNGEAKVLLDGEDVTYLIRTPELTTKVSYIAKAKGVREQMVYVQQNIGSRGNCVFEGRDIGTVVFPGAKNKFYLDADFKERVSRRHKELLQRKSNVSYEEVEKDLRLRDHKDMTREIGPLKKASDAIYIDTTNMTIKEVVDKIAGFIK